MKSLGYYNGRYGELSEMVVPMNDRACYFGDGVYDATYAYDYCVYALDEHLDRLYKSAKLVDINIPYNKEKFKSEIIKMSRLVECREQFVYFQVSRGTAERTHIYPKDMMGNVWIIIKEGKLTDINKPIDIITRQDKRYLYCNIKTLNLLPSVLMAKEASNNACYECVLYRNGMVTECSHSNVHILSEGKLITHPTDCLILDGIARKHLIDACKRLGIEFIEREFSLDEMKSADEIIVTSAGSLCLRVAHCDGESVGGKDESNILRIQSLLIDDFNSYCKNNSRFGE